jgi:hypothetical protein
MPAVLLMQSKSAPTACGLGHDATTSLMPSPSLASAAPLSFYLPFR